MKTGQQRQLPFVFDAGSPYATAQRGTPETPANGDLEALSHAELLSAVLGPVAGEPCGSLLVSAGSLRALAAVHPADLRNQGVNPSAVRRLAAVFELARRFGQEEWVPGTPFRGSYDVYAHFRESLAAESQERFIAVLLDNKNRKLRDVLVSLGSLTASIVHPRDVYTQVIRNSAAAVLFVHNHPSGDPTPSKEDLEITRRLREVGDLVGVRVLDHLIIGKGRYVSLVDDGYW